MIAYLSGTVLKQFDRKVILLTAGVGYLVHVNQATISGLPEGSSASLFISSQVRDGEVILYGFLDPDSLQFFEQLLKVSGIGGKTAIAILDMPIDQTKQAILEENEKYLSTLPGLGKKTAARLILELKSVVNIPASFVRGAHPLRSLQEEALEALLSLGYEKGNILRFLHHTRETFETAEDVVRNFLQHA